MTIYQLLFYFFAGLVVASALVVLFTRNILNAAFSLIFTFLGIAAIYVLAGADFIAITQIIVYVGGILVLMVFGVMLTTKVEGQAVVSRSNNLFLGVLAGLAMLAVLLLVVFSMNFETLDWVQHAAREVPVASSSTVQPIGILLMSRYVLAFELAGLILLIALIGAAFIAKRQIS